MRMKLDEDDLIYLGAAALLGPAVIRISLSTAHDIAEVQADMRSALICAAMLMDVMKGNAKKSEQKIP